MGQATRPAAGGTSSSPAGLAATAVGTVAWGMASILVKLTSIGGLDLPFYRLWFGFALVVVVVLAARRRITWSAIRIALPGALFYCGDVTLFFAALKNTSVAEATFIGSLQPVLIMLVAHRLFGERLTRRQLAWTAPALAGVALVVLGGTGSAGGSTLGTVFAVGALLAWTGYWLTSKHIRATLSTTEYMTGIFLVASVLVTPFALLVGPGVVAPQAIDWLWLALLGIIPGAGHFLFNWAHRFVPATISSLVQAAVPVVATAAAYAILGESLTWLQVAGGVIAVAAIGAICVSSTRDGREATSGST